MRHGTPRVAFAVVMPYLPRSRATTRGNEAASRPLTPPPRWTSPVRSCPPRPNPNHCLARGCHTTDMVQSRHHCAALRCATQAAVGLTSSGGEANMLQPLCVRTPRFFQFFNIVACRPRKFLVAATRRPKAWSPQHSVLMQMRPLPVSVLAGGQTSGSFHQVSNQSCREIFSGPGRAHERRGCIRPRRVPPMGVRQPNGQDASPATRP